jgi:hypothetical protein
MDRRLVVPIYNWAEQTTGTKVSVLRSLDAWELPPTRDECPELTDAQFETATWRREVGEVKTIRGPNWGGKGNW